MFTLILIAVLSATPTNARFADDGSRSEAGKTFAELGRMAINGKTELIRGQSAERMFVVFSRYAGPLNVQYPRCHVGRTFEQLSQRDYLKPQPQALSRDELLDFKAACYAIIHAGSPATKPAMEHLVAVVSHDDLKPMLALLKARKQPGLACIALARIGDDEAVPALARELRGECKEQAAAALQYIASPKSKEALAKGGRLP